VMLRARLAYTNVFAICLRPLWPTTNKRILHEFTYCTNRIELPRQAVD
jgi:hypothetical protein